MFSLVANCVSVFSQNSEPIFQRLTAVTKAPEALVTRARISKDPITYRALKAIAKISRLTFAELFSSHNFITSKVNFHAKFNTYTLFSFWDTNH